MTLEYLYFQVKHVCQEQCSMLSWWLMSISELDSLRWKDLYVSEANEG